MKVDTDKMAEILKANEPLTVFDIVDDNTGKTKMTAMFVLPELTGKVAVFAKGLLSKEPNTAAPIFKGSFQVTDGKLSFNCTTKDVSFEAVLEGITKLRDECQRQISEQNNCPFKPNTAEAPFKTLLECKDEVAKNNDHESFSDMFWYYSDCEGNDGYNLITAAYDEAAEMYADQFRKPVKLVTDEDIHRSITAMHPDIIGNTPLQMLMREKIRISLEWMRKQLTGE